VKSGLLMVILLQLSCYGYLVSGCPILTDLFMLSCPDCPVNAILSWLSCSGCPVLTNLSCLAAQPWSISWLSGPSWLPGSTSSVLVPHPLSPVLKVLSCPGCPFLAVVSWLSCPHCSPCPGYLALAVLLWPPGFFTVFTDVRYWKAVLSDPTVCHYPPSSDQYLTFCSQAQSNIVHHQYLWLSGIGSW
jgi:hypothetical protein